VQIATRADIEKNSPGEGYCAKMSDGCCEIYRRRTSKKTIWPKICEEFSDFQAQILKLLAIFMTAGLPEAGFGTEILDLFHQCFIISLAEA